MTTPKSGPERLTDGVLVLIVLAVGGMAGAASFTHVHDWTIDNSVPGTPDWIGWANALITELIPVAALIVIARRRKSGAPIGYPMFLLVAAVGASLIAQLAVAVATVFGWLSSAMPALAFFALSKLVFSTTKPATPAPGSSRTVDETDVPSTADTVPGHDTVVSEPVADTAPSQPEPSAPIEVPTHLLPTARFAVVNHEQTTGRLITEDELASRMSILPATAGTLLTALGHTKPADTTTTVGRANGNVPALTATPGGDR